MRSDLTMRRLRNRERAPKARRWKIALVLLTAVATVSVAGNTGAVSVFEITQVADRSASNAAGIFKQYCYQCHLRSYKAALLFAHHRVLQQNKNH